MPECAVERIALWRISCIAFAGNNPTIIWSKTDRDMIENVKDYPKE